MVEEPSSSLAAARSGARLLRWIGSTKGIATGPYPMGLNDHGAGSKCVRPSALPRRGRMSVASRSAVDMKCKVEVTMHEKTALATILVFNPDGPPMPYKPAAVGMAKRNAQAMPDAPSAAAATLAPPTLATDDSGAACGPYSRNSPTPGLRSREAIRMCLLGLVAA
jgi:hypothetical protein